MAFHYQRSYRGPLRAVILDWAGTTVDFGCVAPVVVFREVFRRRGVEITLEQARGPMGTYKRDHIAQIAGMDAVRGAWQQAHGAPPTDQDVEQMFQDFVPAQIRVLAEHAGLVPGCLDAIAAFRARGLKIGTTTGYTREMMDTLEPEAARQGYAPDATVCVSDVPEGRPAPWMCFENAKRLGVYPMEAIVKIGDTVPDIEEGLNAGTWTIGVTVTGNEVGATLEEWNAMRPEERQAQRNRAQERLARAGAHYVIDSIADAPPVLDEINARLARGERP